MAKVAFISHASEDEAIATTITDYLESSGVSCWVAPRDVNPGRDYSSEIVEAIESSAVFVLVLSEHANESIFVKREVERAVSKGKPVFPIRVREVLPSKSLELFISSAHWIDAWKPPMEKYLERLAQSISSAANVYPAGKQASIPTPIRKRATRPAPAGQRRRMFAAATVCVVLLLGGAGWYAFQSIQKPSSAPSNGDSASISRAQGNMEVGIDRPGQDFQNFDLSSADPALCESACSLNQNCRAWTYVKPNTIQGPNPRCWLKTGIPNPVSNTCCISGVAVKGGSSGRSKVPTR